MADFGLLCKNKNIVEQLKEIPKYKETFESCTYLVECLPNVGNRMEANDKTRRLQARTLLYTLP